MCHVTSLLFMTMNLAETPICIVIFGASGDLTMRMLIPSIETISCYTHFHPKTKIIGIARTNFKVGELEEIYSNGIKQFSRISPDTNIDNISCEALNVFFKRFTYICGDYNDINTYKSLSIELNKENYKIVLIYLATPPTLIENIISNLGQLDISKSNSTRIIIEKPFGINLKSAKELNEFIHNNFNEEQIYRIDHYLAKETVMNIFTIRWGNTIWEPLWNRNYISHVEIVVSESVDVGKRVGYYDSSTVLRDMIQNHLLQMLSIIAMEPPSNLNPKTIRDEKMKVLNAIRQIETSDVILGQYNGYKEHKGIKPNSTTPTLAVLRLYIDNWRWQGVPFYIISGKCLKKKTSKIKLIFNDVPHQTFNENIINKPNILKIKIQPNEGITLKQHVKVPGLGLRTQQIPLSFSYNKIFGQYSLRGAYERVILDAINGDQSFFPRSDEIEASWRIIEPILKDEYFVIKYSKGLNISYGDLKRKTKFNSIKNYFTNSMEFTITSADLLVQIIERTLKSNGRCNIAISGGNTPQPIFSMISTNEKYIKKIDVNNIHWFFVDERCVPPDDKESNYRMVKECLFDRINVPNENVHRMKGEILPETAADEYKNEILKHFNLENEEVTPKFDVIVLGMGADAHTASLFPGTSACNDGKSLVIAHFVPQVNMHRITLGKRVINNAENVLFLVKGDDKKNALRLVHEGTYVPSLLPAQCVRPKSRKLTWNILMQ
ncbi:glucose-6-phosphate 1-dehydrogenase family protein [Histomonas meleagridis]|uniref:glucose-6-phosphate 1-dehydrogenase family protein n=1 Tax=Histomonas meleagridis TaxID=135588 RepID=UPI00355A4AA1|nr:glucose-6-phosphate 1-dehydrogenase family protein [Histomonas meleagridis]KAH0801519.1 glucose-6-phosphate 1-dehydrogenase family protein [Histomonas meleagridis]